MTHVIQTDLASKTFHNMPDTPAGDAPAAEAGQVKQEPEEGGNTYQSQNALRCNGEAEAGKDFSTAALGLCVSGF